MGNTCGKSLRKDQGSRVKARSGLLAVFVKKEPKKTDKLESIIEEPASKNKQHSSVFEGRPTVRSRRMAVFGEQPSAIPPIKKADPVEIDFIFQVPRSMIIVNPHNFGYEDEFKRVEKKLKGLENEVPIKNILYELFTPMPPKRRSWKDGTKVS